MLIVTADRDDNQISIIDAKKLLPAKARSRSARTPFGVTIDPQGAPAYLADVESNDVSVVDLAGEKLLGSVAVGKRPYAVALAKERGSSTDQYGGTVSVFDLATLRPVKRIPVGDYPEGIETSADDTSRPLA
jgi:YVTN family beta-propeller protein